MQNKHGAHGWQNKFKLYFLLWIHSKMSLSIVKLYYSKTLPPSLVILINNSYKGE
jgi:hypothetical protein